MSNSMSVSMHIGSGKNAINNLEKIKRCDLHNNRKYKNNRNEEIDLTLSKYNVTIAGSKNITEDIKEFYKKEFAEATYKYNQKQPDERRKIVDYLDKMNKDSKSNIAVEFIFQIGDREDWENKSLEDKKKTVEIFKKAIPILEEKGIKTVNASLHLDETSPHLHLIAVPIIENQKRGLSKQVSQNKVITKEIIKEIRSKVEKSFIEEYNKIYGTNKELKKGSEIEEHLQVQDYKNTKKVLEVAKNTADKQVLKEKIEQDYKKLADEVKEKEKENNFLTNQITKLDAENKEKLKRKNELEKTNADLENTINNINKENLDYKETLERNKKELEISNADITKEIKELESKNIEIKKIKEAKEQEFEKEFLYKANKIKEIEDLKKEIEQKEIELKELEEKRKAEEKKKNDFIAEAEARKKRDEAIEKAIENDKEKLKAKQEEQTKIKKELENIENIRTKIENDIELANKKIEDNKNILEKTNAEIKKLNEDIETAIKNKEKLEKEKQEIAYTEEEAREDIIKLIENKNDDLTIVQVENFIDDFAYEKNNKILSTVAGEIKKVLQNFIENVDGYRKIVSENFRENVENIFTKNKNTKNFNKNNNDDDMEY